MPAAATLTRARGRLELAGDLTGGSVPGLFAQTPRFDAESMAESAVSAGASAEPAALCIDLRAVGEVDSSGLALLLHWRGVAARSNARLTFTGAPAQLREMAKITGVETLLDLATSGANAAP